MQDPHTQQVKTSAPIHLSLQELESIDMTFDLPAAPRGCERSAYRVEVGPQTGRKAAQFGYNAVSRPLQPLVKSRQIAAVNQAEKIAG